MRYAEIVQVLEGREGAFPAEAYELISAFVTHGEMRASSEFDDIFERLMVLLPRLTRGAVLYRVLKLSSEELTTLKENGLQLISRNFSSWTKDVRCLERLIYDRTTDGVLPTIVKADIKANDIVVDVARFYEKYHLISAYFPEWTRYVRPEQEVIVREPSTGGLRLTADMIVRPSWLSDDILDQAAPREGTIFIATDGSRDIILKVASSDEQSGSCLFRIVTRDGDPAFVRWDRAHSRWIEVER